MVGNVKLLTDSLGGVIGYLSMAWNRATRTCSGVLPDRMTSTFSNKATTMLAKVI